MIFTKALFYHILQKKSWRATGKLLGANHITLYNFYGDYKHKPEIKKLFLHFAETGIIIYTQEKKQFHIEEMLKNKQVQNATIGEIHKLFEI